MALQVWLPLLGNLNNQGIAGSIKSVTSSGSSTNANGKLGSCIKITSSTDTTFTPNFNTTSITLCGWFKFNKSEIGTVLNGLTYSSNAHSPTGNLFGNNSYGGIGLIWTGNNINSSGSFSSMTINASIRTSTISLISTSSFTVSFDTWTHIALIWNVSTRIISLYKDGVLIDSKSVGAFSDGVSRSLRINYNIVYSGNGPTAQIPIYSNDVRIYDHALSPKEVKELSKGLVLHYKLDGDNGFQGGVNLVKNGYGGTENWNNSNYSTTEIPSVTGVTHSYFDSETKEFIPIIPSHSYKLSTYMKSKTGTGSCYFSFIPYDIDKNQITYEKTADGFRASSLTTLSQDLKSGDTIVHLTNASGWANPGTYQYVLAIFGYTDSTGYTYPDLVYTRTILTFGTTSDKSHLDVANNRVTLNAVYTGQTIPKGTSICLTGYGSTYYYPIILSASAAASWVQKEYTFIPQNINYLKAAKYLKVKSISGYQYLTAISLIDITLKNIIYDCSGNKYNGSVLGTLTLSNTGSPRYNFCSVFNGIDSGVLIENLNIGNIINTAMTYSFWIKPEGENGGRSIYFGSYSGNSFSIEKTSGNKLRLYWNGSPDTTSNLSITDGSWQHIVITKTSTTTIKVYLNGELIQTVSNTFNNITFPTTFRLGRDTRSSDGTPYKGSMSDFRIYATVLSDADVKELYNTPTFIDNQGDLLTHEFDEHLNNMIDVENYGIIKKQWLRGLTKSTQANCQCTLENDGYRIYRPANITYNSSDSSTRTMWGGFVLDNANNRFGLIDGHTYVIEFEVKGKSSCTAGDISWSNNVGWASGGLNAAPTNVVKINPVVANFNTSEWKYFSYRWTISDGLYKTCTSSYSSFVAGQTYISYRHFKFGYSYESTGSLGTDIYIRNIRMYDITSNIEIMINKTGIVDSGSFIEDGIETQFFKDKIIKSTQFLEI